MAKQEHLPCTSCGEVGPRFVYARPSQPVKQLCKECFDELTEGIVPAAKGQAVVAGRSYLTERQMCGR